MSRESIYDRRMVQASISMPIHLLDRLKTIAKEGNTTLSALVRPMLEEKMSEEYPEISDEETLGDC